MAGSLAILTACAHEAQLVRRALQDQRQLSCEVGSLWQGTVHRQEVTLLQCGMGAARAAQGVRWLHKHAHLTGVLSVGFAGGLQADLGVGDALLSTHVFAQDIDAPILHPDARLAHVATMAVAQTAIVSHAGTLLSTTAVLAQAAVKQMVGRLSGALAVDMESYSVGQTATTCQLPFAVLRTIFDPVHEDFALPVATCTTVTGSLQPVRLAGCLCAQPWLLSKLPYWWWASRVAGRHLQQWLQAFFLLVEQGA